MTFDINSHNDRIRTKAKELVEMASENKKVDVESFIKVLRKYPLEETISGRAKLARAVRNTIGFSPNVLKDLRLSDELFRILEYEFGWMDIDRVSNLAIIVSYCLQNYEIHTDSWILRNFGTGKENYLEDYLETDVDKFTVENSMLIYYRTHNDKYLPQTVKDVFVF
jgi:hypothetical protein